MFFQDELTQHASALQIVLAQAQAWVCLVLMSIELTLASRMHRGERIDIANAVNGVKRRFDQQDTMSEDAALALERLNIRSQANEQTFTQACERMLLEIREYITEFRRSADDNFARLHNQLDQLGNTIPPRVMLTACATFEDAHATIFPIYTDFVTSWEVDGAFAE